jgi:hypothetical protein
VQLQGRLNDRSCTVLKRLALLFPMNGSLFLLIILRLHQESENFARK